MASRNSFPDEEFNDFECKVDEIGEIMKDLCSSNDASATNALKKADDFLKGRGTEVIEGTKLKTVQNKTVINQKAFDDMKNSEDDSQLSKEAFMAQMEADAKQRAEDKRMRSEEANSFKTRGNAAFRQKDYEKALHLYNQAIACTKESHVLFTNRALTCIHLQLYQRAIEDCDWVLKFDQHNLKALLYKGRALQRLEKYSEADKCFDKAIQHFAPQKKLIQEFQNDDKSHPKVYTEESKE